ncbi:hypothetical protein DY000_02039492 [Brassica cretica]|uniref:Uncharacterized protein n=1 Tax=Brassica cretica TaxID=69181 RepID=A0ABQ7BJ25_BRACR|nr:hypothetical protein DY000_02039492 [Brassica cretica]
MVEYLCGGRVAGDQIHDVIGARRENPKLDKNPNFGIMEVSDQAEESGNIYRQVMQPDIWEEWWHPACVLDMQPAMWSTRCRRAAHASGAMQGDTRAATNLKLIAPRDGSVQLNSSRPLSSFDDQLEMLSGVSSALRVQINQPVEVCQFLYGEAEVVSKKRSVQSTPVMSSIGLAKSSPINQLLIGKEHLIEVMLIELMACLLLLENRSTMLMEDRILPIVKEEPNITRARVALGKDDRIAWCWTLGPLVVFGVKNGYDEVNVQITEVEKRRNFFDKYFFEIDSSLRKPLRKKRESSDKSSRRIVTKRPNTCSARSLRSDRVRVKAQLLRSDRARTKVRSLHSDRALTKRQYDISPCILVYPSMLSPEYHSEPISHSQPFLSYQSNFTVKTAESSFFIERSRNKRFESKDGPKGPKTYTRGPTYDFLTNSP